MVNIACACFSRMDMPNGNSSVKRCLFGRPDNSRRQMNALRASFDNSNAARFRERWNYDVATDTALEGTYKWIPPPADIPAFYARGYEHRCKRRRVQQRRDPDENSDNGSRSPVSSQAPDGPCGEAKVMLGVPQASFAKQVDDETTPPKKSDSSHLVGSGSSNLHSNHGESESTRVPRTIQARLIEYYTQTKKSGVCVKKRRTDS